MARYAIWSMRRCAHRPFKLIERAAQAVADAVLDRFPLVQEIDIELKKPWAPIGLPVAYASVKITRGR